MSLVPQNPIDKVQFYETHNAPWTANAVAIGTTPAEVAALEAKTQAARAAYDTQRAALQAAKTATEAFYAAVLVMGTAGAAVLKQVRAKGESTGDPNVYTLAQIPGPATPTTKPGPGTPEGLKVALNGNGTLNLTWKCKNPVGTSGTMYQVFRRIGGAGEFIYLGGSGEKTFADATVPAGATAVTYQIQAVRSTSAGLFATFNVYFGDNTTTPVAPTVTTAPAVAPRLAA